MRGVMGDVVAPFTRQRPPPQNTIKNTIPKLGFTSLQTQQKPYDKLSKHRIPLGPASRSPWRGWLEARNPNRCRSKTSPVRWEDHRSRTATSPVRCRQVSAMLLLLLCCGCMKKLIVPQQLLSNPKAMSRRRNIHVKSRPGFKTWLCPTMWVFDHLHLFDDMRRSKQWRVYSNPSVWLKDRRQFATACQ